MPSSCVAINCSVERSPDTLKQGITFHRFPKDPVRRVRWCSAMRRQSTDRQGTRWLPTKNSVLCSRHFTHDMFDRTGQTVRLRDCAIPSVFDFRQRMRGRKLNVEGRKKSSEGLEGGRRRTRSTRSTRSKRSKRSGPQGVQMTGQSSDSPASLGDLTLAAELFEVVSDTVRQVQMGARSQRGFLNDHSCLPIPSEPARLCAMVRGLAKDHHRQEQALLSLQKAVEGKEKLLQKKKKQWEWEMHTLTAARDSRIKALEEQLRQQQGEGAAVLEELRQTRLQLRASAEAVLSLGTQMRQQRQPSPRPTILSAHTLGQGSPKWLRFYTGFHSYARFKAFLSFLQGGDGAGLGLDLELEAGVDEETLEEIHSNSPKTLDSGAQMETALSPGFGDSEGETAELVPWRITEPTRGGGAVPNLSPEDQLLLVLTRLRLGLLLQDLAFRFCVAESTVSRIWVHWMELLQKKLQQIPVKCSQRYISFFQPKHTLALGAGRVLTVLECSDLLFDASSRDRQRAAGRVGGTSQPYRVLTQHRGCVVASPEGFLGFASSGRLEEWEDWTADPCSPQPSLPALPRHLLEEMSAPPAAWGVPSPEVLSVRSLTDKVLTFRYLRVVHPHGCAAQLDRAWEVCCYLACLLHQPMGLRLEC